jgi:hypothetical protein
MGIKVRGKIPDSAKELENPDNVIDFSIPRCAISRIGIRNLAKNRNLYVVQIRGGRALVVREFFCLLLHFNCWIRDLTAAGVERVVSSIWFLNNLLLQLERPNISKNRLNTGP